MRTALIASIFVFGCGQPSAQDPTVATADTSSLADETLETEHDIRMFSNYDLGWMIDASATPRSLPVEAESFGTFGPNQFPYARFTVPTSKRTVSAITLDFESRQADFVPIICYLRSRNGSCFKDSGLGSGRAVVLTVHPSALVDQTRTVILTTESNWNSRNTGGHGESSDRQYDLVSEFTYAD
jgi:hypothetical protein